MKNIKLRSVFGVAIAATVLLIGACKKDDAVVDGTASLRIVNAYEGSSPQDFYQGDSKLASGVVYGTANAKVYATTGSHVLKFTDANSAEANASTTVSLSLNSSSLVFYNKKADGTGELLGYESGNVSVPAGKSLVRFINLGGLLSSTIDVDAGPDKVVSSLVFKAVTDYVLINTGTSLSFGVTGSTTGTIPASEFDAGKIYTVWFDSTTAATVNYHIVGESI